MLAIFVTGVFSIIVVLLLAAVATKVFSNSFHPNETNDRWWADDPDDNEPIKSEILQHPSNFTDYR